MMHVGPRHYAGVFAVLMFLTLVTIGAAYQDFGAFNTIIALGIAAIKASLVIAIFMHVRWSGPIVGIFAISGFVWLGIMILLLYADIATR
jgi:cytochrome c oxidase subunit IV